MANDIHGLKRALLAALCLATGAPGSGVVRGADGPKEIEAQRLVLKDKNGKAGSPSGSTTRAEP
jgi:hypothetical protein